MPRTRTNLEPEHGWPLGWGASLIEFRTHLAVERGLSANTASAYISDLDHLAAWACDQEIPPTPSPAISSRHSSSPSRARASRRGASPG